MAQRKKIVDSSSEESSREVVFTRVLAAPRELVWKAWTSPAHLPQWWGRRGFSITTLEIDVRVGGIWRFTMHAPDGTNYPNRIVYREIRRPEQLVYGHGTDDDPDQFVTTVSFDDLGAKTKLTMRVLFRSAEERDKVIREHHAVDLGNQTLDRMEGYVQEMVNTEPCADREIVSMRIVNATRAAVWGAWADPASLARWWGPNGFTNTVHEFDLRPGGRWRLTMHGPDGTSYPNEKVFTAVVSPELVAFRHVEEGHDFLMTLHFADLGEKTKVTWHIRFDSAADCARVRAFVIPANEENFDRLEAHLTQANSKS